MERAMGAQNGQGRWWNRPGIVERLKLTDEQRKSFDDILLAHREKLIDLRANLAKAELALEPLMRGNPPDEGKVLAQIDTIAQARAELEKANAAFLLEIRARLTPEQWKQLQAARANRGQIRGGVQGGSGQYRPQAQAPTVPEEDVIPEPAASGTER
jgi:Spy/CpxP family protein refolding chaperone